MASVVNPTENEIEIENKTEHAIDSQSENDNNENENRMLAKFSYLAIVPRGLQNEIASGLREQANAVAALDVVDETENYNNSRNGEHDNNNNNNCVLKVTTWNETEDRETMREALRDLSVLRREKQDRQQRSIENKKKIAVAVAHQPNKVQLEEHVFANWLPPSCSVGSVKLSSSGQHVSIGYCHHNKSSDVAITAAATPPTTTTTPTAASRAASAENSHPSATDFTRSALSTPSPSPSQPPHSVPTWSCTGQMAGSVWMQLETNRPRISQTVIAPSRSMGPLLALISVQTDNRCLEATPPPPPTTAAAAATATATTTTQTAQTASDANENDCRHDRYKRYHRHSLEEMTAELLRHVRSDPVSFSERRDRAVRLWKDCAEETWRGQLSPPDYEGLKRRIEENRLRFRVSAVRVEPTLAPSPSSRKRKKKFTSVAERFAYSRKELCAAIMDACGRDLVPGFRPTPRTEPGRGDESSETLVRDADSDGDNNRGSKSAGRWTVDLDAFDLELVVFLIPPDDRSDTGRLALGISLRPYSFLGSKSFETGHVPPDVTAPYLGGDLLSKGVLRLRPTTAHLLLQMADLQPCDVVLDPCAGIGTIPLEAEWYQGQGGFETSGTKQYLAIGGDLVLNNPRFTNIAGMMESMGGNGIGNNNRNSSSTSSNNTSSMLVAWDAAHLPMRTGSVDVAISDLPFGQQCLSVNSLNQLLPLIFLECARVLRPCTGRMVVLAGGSPIGLIANIEKLSGDYWERPIRRVSPVSIGGILAWIVVAARNGKAFDRSGVPNQRDLVRKIAEKRDRISRQRRCESGEQHTGGLRRNAAASGVQEAS
eukprot:jgi/Psemu1/7075/gm1.7075_g